MKRTVPVGAEEYRCRRCGAVYHHYGDTELLDWCERVRNHNSTDYQIEFYRRAAGVTPEKVKPHLTIREPLFDIHECDNHGRGVADLIGMGSLEQKVRHTRKTGSGETVWYSSLKTAEV